MFKSNKDRLKGGKADNIPDSKFDKMELKLGQKHEKEHTKDPNLAKEIAKDHIVEDPKYYDKLAKIEGDTKNEALDSAADPVYNAESDGSKRAAAVAAPIKIKLVKKIAESSFMASGAVSLAPTAPDKKEE